jgi:hypothetical protein
MLARQRGLPAVAMATAWDTCCRRLAQANDSVGYLLLSAGAGSDGVRT